MRSHWSGFWWVGGRAGDTRGTRYARALRVRCQAEDYNDAALEYLKSNRITCADSGKFVCTLAQQTRTCAREICVIIYQFDVFVCVRAVANDEREKNAELLTSVFT